MEKTEFPLTPIDIEAPVETLEFWKFLVKYPYKTFTQAILSYCATFDSSKNFISKQQFNSHKLVFNHFWWAKLNCQKGLWY